VTNLGTVQEQGLSLGTESLALLPMPHLQTHGMGGIAREREGIFLRHIDMEQDKKTYLFYTYIFIT
jgi:hypothetical protein